MVRAWDLAATEAGGYDDPDYTVGLLMARDPNTSIIYIADVIRGRWSPAKLWSQIETAALVDGTSSQIRLSCATRPPRTSAGLGPGQRL